MVTYIVVPTLAAVIALALALGAATRADAAMQGATVFQTSIRAPQVAAALAAPVVMQIAIRGAF